MDLGNALKKSGRNEITIRSIISNTIKEMYPRNITITSVRVQKKVILIKTGNPLINSELQMMRGDIRMKIIEKLNHLGVKIDSDISIKFT